MLGFSTSTTGIVVPVPDLAYTLEIWWWQKFTNWIAGGTLSGTFNLPDEHMRIIGILGAPAALQFTEPENATRAMAMWKQFQDKARAIKSQDSGGRGGQVVVKSRSYSRAPTDFYPVG